MTLGVAIFIVFMLYLIDKHNLWRISAKITIGLVIVAVIAGAALYRYEQQRQKQKAAFLQCVTRNTAQGDAYDVDQIRAKCEADSSITLPVAKETSQIVPDTPKQATRLKPAAPKHYVYSLRDDTLTSRDCASGMITGEVSKGERLELLGSSSYCGVKVRNTKGQVGWVYPASAVSTIEPQ